MSTVKASIKKRDRDGIAQSDSTILSLPAKQWRSIIRDDAVRRCARFNVVTRRVPRVSLQSQFTIRLKLNSGTPRGRSLLQTRSARDLLPGMSAASRFWREISSNRATECPRQLTIDVDYVDRKCISIR